MNRKIIVVVFTISLLTILTSCMNNNSIVSKTDSSELNTITFGEIHNLSNQVEFVGITLTLYDPIIEISDSEDYTQPKLMKLNHEQFKDVYNYLVDLKCDKTEPSKMVENGTDYEYSITIGIKENGESRGFMIYVGKSYLMVNLLRISDDIYLYEINENDYINIKSLLDLIINQYY